MAGIGFSLRKILTHDSLTRVGASGIIAGEPWLIAISGLISLLFVLYFFPKGDIFFRLMFMGGNNA